MSSDDVTGKGKIFSPLEAPKWHEIRKGIVLQVFGYLSKYGLFGGKNPRLQDIVVLAVFTFKSELFMVEK